MITRSTRASRAAAIAPAARASSASNSTMGQTTTPAADSRKDLLEQRELCQQIRLDAFGGLVAWPQLVAKGFNDVIGRHRHVCGPALHHPQHRREHAADGSHFATVLIPRGWQCVVVPKQFVGTVHQINFQESAPTQPYKTAANSINCRMEARACDTIPTIGSARGCDVFGSPGRSGGDKC